MDTTRPLRAALLANALFSMSCGVAMIVAPTRVGAWLGLDVPLALQIVGAGLLLFAADLIHQATRPRMSTWRALYASAADFLWVAASVAGLLLFVDVLSVSGLRVIGAVAALVFAFGVRQVWAIDRAHRTLAGQHRHCVQVHVPVPAEAMWQVVGRIGDIGRCMPSLQVSEILDGKIPGVGAVRRCVDQRGKAWSEECVAFDPGRSFVVRFLTEAPGFPFPAHAMIGGWGVTPTGDGCDVQVWWELEPKPRLLAPILLPILAFQADRDFTGIIARMAAEAAGADATVAADRRVGLPARLLLRAC
jgi:hypothetical protein